MQLEDKFPAFVCSISKKQFHLWWWEDIFISRTSKHWIDVWVREPEDYLQIEAIHDALTDTLSLT